MRDIIIGDVHGCCETLNILLSRTKPDCEQDRIILLGDLFDRGPDSRGVFLTVKQLAESFGERFVLLRGNHEDYLLQPQLTIRQKMIWEKVGRQATIRSFQHAGEQMEDTIPWLQEHISLFFRDDTLQCVHAGLLVEPIEANDLQTLIHDHEMVTMNRYTGRLTITGHIALKKATWYTGDGKTTKELEEDQEYSLPENGIICIDTGCGKGGKLTAMIVCERRFSLLSAIEKAK